MLLYHLPVLSLSKGLPAVPNETIKIRDTMSDVPMGSADSMFAPVEYAGNNK